MLFHAKIECVNIIRSGLLLTEVDFAFLGPGVDWLSHSSPTEAITLRNFNHVNGGS